MGLVSMEDELRAGERILAGPTLPRTSSFNRGIDLTDLQFDDEIQLSADRRTLRLSLRAASSFSDHIRVLPSPRD